MMQIPSSGRLRTLAVFTLLSAVILAACGESESSIPGAVEPMDDPFAGGYPMYRSEDHGLRIIVGTPDLGVGEPRVSLAFFDSNGVVAAPSLVARTYFFPDGPGGTRESTGDERTLAYSEFPFGGRGIYVSSMRFERAGLYAIEADVPRDSGETARVLIPLEVAEEPGAPDIGDPVPASEHRTLADVDSIEELTTSWEPDPALYHVTIAEVIERAQPLVVIFTSPAFCTTALCGPQVELASELVPDYGDRVAFIHIDLYENPHEIQGDLDRARRSPLLDEWNITTDQWTFVADASGQITARFEGFVPRGELEAAIDAALEIATASR